MYNYFGLWAIGGIGRHARLKIWFSSESASSSLASPTIENKVLFEYKSVLMCVLVNLKPLLTLTYRGTEWIQNPLNFGSCPFESD